MTDHAEVAIPEPEGLVLSPFRGVRYAPDRVRDLGTVTSPPYDLIDPVDGIDHLMAAHPNNVVRLTLPLPQDREDRYLRAAATLRTWAADGVLQADHTPSLYVYEQRFPGLLQRGLLGAVGLTRPERGIVLPHERTVPAVVEDRLRLMEATDANLEPILLLYNGGGYASAVVDDIVESRRPLLVATTEDGATHRMWPVTDPSELAGINADLLPRHALIADGHHRYTTYLRLQEGRHRAGHGPGPWDYGLALLVDSTAHPPTLGAVHRVIPRLSPALAIERAESVGRVVAVSEDLSEALARLTKAATRGPAFLVTGERTHYLLSDIDRGVLDRAVPESRSPRWARLATTVLHYLLISEVWGIPEDPRSVLTIHHDAVEATKIAKETGGTAVILQPIPLDDVFAVAADGEQVPRKSTSFTPKPRTGLVMRSFAADSNEIGVRS